MLAVGEVVAEVRTGQDWSEHGKKKPTHLERGQQGKPTHRVARQWAQAWLLERPVPSFQGVVIGMASFGAAVREGQNKKKWHSSGSVGVRLVRMRKKSNLEKKASGQKTK